MIKVLYNVGVAVGRLRNEALVFIISQQDDRGLRIASRKDAY